MGTTAYHKNKIGKTVEAPWQTRQLPTCKDITSTFFLIKNSFHEKKTFHAHYKKNNPMLTSLCLLIVAGFFTGCGGAEEEADTTPDTEITGNTGTENSNPGSNPDNDLSDTATEDGNTGEIADSSEEVNGGNEQTGGNTTTVTTPDNTEADQSNSGGSENIAGPPPGVEAGLPVELIHGNAIWAAWQDGKSGTWRELARDSTGINSVEIRSQDQLFSVASVCVLPDGENILTIQLASYQDEELQKDNHKIWLCFPEEETSPYHTATIGATNTRGKPILYSISDLEHSMIERSSISGSSYIANGTVQVLPGEYSLFAYSEEPLLDANGNYMGSTTTNIVAKENVTISTDRSFLFDFNNSIVPITDHTFSYSGIDTEATAAFFSVSLQFENGKSGVNEFMDPPPIQLYTETQSSPSDSQSVVYPSYTDSQFENRLIYMTIASASTYPADATAVFHQSVHMKSYSNSYNSTVLPRTLSGTEIPSFGITESPEGRLHFSWETYSDPNWGTADRYNIHSIITHDNKDNFTVIISGSRNWFGNGFIEYILPKFDTMPSWNNQWTIDSGSKISSFGYMAEMNSDIENTISVDSFAQYVTW